MLSGLDHLVITVGDVPRAVDFYTRVLGLEAHYRDGERVDLRLGDLALRLHQAEPGITAPGAQTLCFRSLLPLAEVRQHLETLAVPVELGPVPRQGAVGPVESLYLRDPDGNRLELCRPAR